MNARLIAHYLPQFHPIPENDEWWEPGFTEWTNVARAKPLFPGHDQPRVPADLGFYDLRVPEVRIRQAELAREAGIEAFCYWHYWFGGRRILERPFNEVVASGKPDFPFCLAWANETWQGVWHGLEKTTLIEQTYGGQSDADSHFNALLEAFRDPRYLKVEGRLLFFIYRPNQIPNPKEFIDRWRVLAKDAGLPGFYFVAHTLFMDEPRDWEAEGFDGTVLGQSLKIIRKRAWDVVRERFNRNTQLEPENKNWANATKAFARLLKLRMLQRIFRWPGSIFEYSDACLFTTPKGPLPLTDYPTSIPNWDNSPRAGRKGVIFSGATPEKYRSHLRQVIKSVQHKPLEQRLIFVKSWNEWAEGNYLEPDQRYGKKFIEVTKEEVTR